MSHSVSQFLTGANELEIAVTKATSKEEEAPKRKHVRNCVILSVRANGANAFYRELTKRPLGNNATVCYKALHTTHHVLQEGPAKALSDSHYQLSMFQSIKGNWVRGQDPHYSHLIAEYAAVLIDKINFHHHHPEFDGSLNLDEYLKKLQGNLPSPDRSIQIVNHLFDLQEAILKFEKMIFTIKLARDLNECRISPLVPLVVESYAIYTLLTWFLRKLVDAIDTQEIFSMLTERYYSQYMLLKEFYFEAANVKYVSSLIVVPTLPKDPPTFTPTKKKAAKPEPQSQPMPQAYQPSNQPQMMADPNANLFFTGNDVGRELSTAHNRPNWYNFGEPAVDVSQQYQPPQPVYQPPPQPVQQYIPPPVVQEQPRQPEIDWQARLLALERELEKERAEKELMRKEIEKLKSENEELKKRLRSAWETQAAERKAMTDGVISAARDAIERCMRHLDNPTHLGNQNATPEDVIESQKNVLKCIEALENASRTGNQSDMLNAVRNLGLALDNLMNNVKGVSRLTDDPRIKQGLFDAAREAGNSLQRLLDALANQSSDPTGPANATQDLREKLGLVLKANHELTTAGQEEPISENEGKELEDFAEKELMAAAKVIEEAARALMAARSKPKPQDFNPEMGVVAEAIMDAALAITTATGNLIKQATIAQRERVAKGRASGGASWYKKDRTWAEGLISAAKAVAQATVALVDAANKCANGEIDAEGLEAASQAVASATAQLVAASRVTSDPFSATQKALENASGAVKNATRLLVDAAKKPQENAQPTFVTPRTQIGMKVAEINIQADILRAEKQLGDLRKRLFELRKAEYGQGPN